MSQLLFDELGNFSLPALSDCAGTSARIIHTLKPIRSDLKVAGPAYTVAGMAGDNLAMHRGMYHCPPGHVLVATVQGGDATGHWGGLMAIAAKHKGIRGLVIDGSIRDANEIADLPFPIFALGVNPRKSIKSYRGEINVPITCAGVQINPGDVIVGDEHGVMALSADAVPAILERARQLQQREEKIIARLNRGESLSDIQGVDVS
ncbi:MAG: Regulator of RNase E activity RraA [Chloroflexi bacterium AL-N10]|nr:Regulator of RNase E activity RraA [Chloroflexi bacterium AL-N1]NOK66692.1 Regulator of RNase E activity RraA [Chloroflexi bacterium AL-N10]NOK72080.1 Regulator of RNase E activity RraA [Chloroflexi bacterium AL-N5]